MRFCDGMGNALDQGACVDGIAMSALSGEMMPRAVVVRYNNQ